VTVFSGTRISRERALKTEETDAKTSDDVDIPDADDRVGGDCANGQFVLEKGRTIARAGRSPPAAGRPGAAGQ
jgi:hypothetical protein